MKIVQLSYKPHKHLKVQTQQPNTQHQSEYYSNYRSSTI